MLLTKQVSASLFWEFVSPTAFFLPFKTTDCGLLVGQINYYHQ